MGPSKTKAEWISPEQVAPSSTCTNTLPTTDHDHEGIIGSVHQVWSFTLKLKGRYTLQTPHRDVHLPVILGLLTDLRAFTLVTLDGTGWPQFDNDIVIAMFKLHRLPSLRTLMLYGYLSIPIEFLLRWTNLEHVTIYGSPFKPLNMNTSNQVVPLYVKGQEMVQFKSLQLISDFAGVNNLLDEEDRTTLRRWAVLYGHQDRLVLWSILFCTCTTLQTIMLCNIYYGEFIPFVMVSADLLFFR